MPSAFTHYWQRQRFVPNGKAKYGTEAFSSLFTARGVSTGDRVFFVNVLKGKPYLVGAITVSSSPVELENGLQRIRAVAGSGARLNFERSIPMDVARRIVRFPGGGGWKFASRDSLDQQTLRGVQRITDESAMLLNGLLGVNNAAILAENLFPDEIDAEYSSIVGAATRIMVNRFERDPKAREACLRVRKCICIVCGFDFGKHYGELGVGFIHVHHTTPISQLREGYKINPESDLVPVCPNCHAMLHRKDPPLTIQELQKVYRKHLK